MQMFLADDDHVCVTCGKGSQKGVVAQVEANRFFLCAACLDGVVPVVSGKRQLDVEFPDESHACVCCGRTGEIGYTGVVGRNWFFFCWACADETIPLILNTWEGLTRGSRSRRGREARVPARDYTYDEIISNLMQPEDHREPFQKGNLGVSIFLVPARASAPGRSVKIVAQFGTKPPECRSITVKYAVDQGEWLDAPMRQKFPRRFEVVLDNLPTEQRIMLYLELHDARGATIPIDNISNAFTIESSGHLLFEDAGEDQRLVPCPTCGYPCRAEWDECPHCNTLLHSE